MSNRKDRELLVQPANMSMDGYAKKKISLYRNHHQTVILYARLFYTGKNVHKVGSLRYTLKAMDNEIGNSTL